jgi:hypothetical protein
MSGLFDFVLVTVLQIVNPPPGTRGRESRSPWPVLVFAARANPLTCAAGTYLAGQANVDGSFGCLKCFRATSPGRPRHR